MSTRLNFCRSVPPEFLRSFFFFFFYKNLVFSEIQTLCMFLYSLTIPSEHLPQLSGRSNQSLSPSLPFEVHFYLYLSKLLNVFVQISNCICSNSKKIFLVENLVLCSRCSFLLGLSGPCDIAKLTRRRSPQCSYRQSQQKQTFGM